MEKLYMSLKNLESHMRKGASKIFIIHKQIDKQLHINSININNKTLILIVILIFTCVE